MGRLEAEPLVEPVRLGSRVVRGELDPVTPQLRGPLHGGAHQDSADAVPPVIGVHVHRLHLRAEPAPGLEMAEHDELADPDDLPSTSATRTPPGPRAISASAAR